MKGSLKKVVLKSAEVVLFCLAFAILIPPVLSREGQVYSLAPTLIIGVVLFVISLGLAYRRKAEDIISLIIKLIFFTVFAWALHIRVWGF